MNQAEFMNRARLANLATSRTMPHFWGVNGHLTWNWSPNGTPYFKANWAVACLRMLELGARVYRNGYGWSEDGTGAITASDGATFVDFITNYAQPCGIQVNPVLLMTYGHATITNETTAYNFGFARGVEAATKLKGLVPSYTISNELETWSITGRGNWRGDYDSVKFAKSRGLLRGTIAGIKSVDPQTPLICGGTWLHTAFYDNLLKGIDPATGNTGQPLVDWDITEWHWYLANYPGNDDIENATAQGNFNTLATIAAWGKPIHITECGAQADSYTNNEAAISAAITGPYLLQRLWAVRKTYNIQHISHYQLFDAAGVGAAVGSREMSFGLIANDGVTKKQRFGDIQNFMKLHANP